MKIGRDLVELAKEIQRQRSAKRDFVADTRKTELIVDMVDASSSILRPSPKKVEKVPQVKLALDGKMIVGINPLAHDQIGGHTKIPAAYYDRMLKEEPDLLVTNVNRWFQKYPAARMIRTLDGSARAFLSDRYRALDNADLLEAALPPLTKMGVMIMSCEVTDTKLYLKVVDKRIKQDLPVGWNPKNKGHSRFDTVSPALVLSNSEVGAGALSVQTSVWTEGCSNMMVIKERSHRKYHIGSRHDLGDDAYALLSDKTKRLTDKALWAQIGDVVKAAFDRAKFDATCEVLAAATQEKIEGDVPEVVELTAKKFGLSEDEKGSVLDHLIRGGDLSKYGLHSAITRTAEDVENYDRASWLEQLGGTVVELPKSEWQTINVKKTRKEAA